MGGGRKREGESACKHERERAEGDMTQLKIQRAHSAPELSTDCCVGSGVEEGRTVKRLLE